ncbi:TetR/AcrR family transcriptional regulator [Sulfitobacter mediterraneus]|jgi:AcrR family transcriptional regulator|uniref:TetR/AcrR family transcriptional regulator n=1 Tax=Sulfitobacter mediterraneus TaxID=83219 RepID=UPI001934374B|nr:TetR/AcrR family transcriptional regulator [Sulfitobacter mediterraneus]MBM1311983.1 TetR/AcrR family transcriptional regulator [Sulfitobacter mediterraneus]MBM1315880.1 TetR/AcrR family transcriptional regulator [Sulfitobacter mediterraneus]MBM1324226.1 TetR/AcrR family transcriptional regulator [Sulfitobacter mediterraneus]MBM1328131.1 TetR/AcrR family transcriptional regulator [Sulfitobacter mediterraneus]MBM1399528.1 TetR/AcrR family transcriptional regulator [Sulfitobacter mediterraneu
MRKPDTDSYRPTKQARSARSEQLLLDAAEALFAEHGFQGTKVTDIIERSGCSIGTFYHRFGDKEGLARVLIHRFIEDGTTMIDALDLSRSKCGDLPGMLRYLAGVLYDTMTDKLGVYRASQRLNSLASKGEVNTAVLVAPLAAHVLVHAADYSDEISAPDGEAALRQALQLIVMITWQTRLGAGTLFPKDRGPLIEMMVKSAMGLLKEDAKR